MKIDFLDFSPKHFRPRVFKVNYSSTFLVRTKCMFCRKSPDSYYWVPLPSLWLSPDGAKIMFDWFKKYIKRMSAGWYKKYQPQHFLSLKEFNFYWSEKSYNPRLHQYRDMNANVCILEYLSCPCGKTLWAINQRNGERRSEIKNRKARYKYPQKFESY